MTDRIAALQALLRQAESAHGVYEHAELNDVYDQDWPQWYASYLVDQGIGELVGRDVAAEELGAFLASSWAEIKAADPDPTDPWSVLMASRIAERFGRSESQG